jgi:hypothetical protein
MHNDRETDLYPASTLSSKVTEVFIQVMQTRQISFADWYELMTAPLEDSESSEYQGDLITRLIYAVRQGIVKVVDEH